MQAIGYFFDFLIAFCFIFYYTTQLTIQPACILFGVTALYFQFRLTSATKQQIKHMHTHIPTLERSKSKQKKEIMAQKK